MPVGKRRKSLSTESNNKEKEGVRMPTETSDTGDEEKSFMSNDVEETCVTASTQVGLSLKASVSDPCHPGEKDEEVQASCSTSHSQTLFAQPNSAKNLGTRSSTRVIKRPKRDTPSPPPSPVKKQVVKEIKTSTPETKSKRQWEFWGNVDKRAFFDGLYEFGKDFDAIQGQIALKCKRKGFLPGLIRNKDQVRHFYYRTWHKISKYIHFPPDIKKQTKELYGLINYGELRKRIGGSFAERYLQKLNELVHKGTILVRVKGKNHRIRTPICPALKKLNNIEEPKTDDRPKVPTKVTLEIGPKTNAAWAHVQDLSQNPRLRIRMKATQRLSAVMAFLEKKWKPQRLRIKESLDAPENSNRELRLFPHKDCEIRPVTLKIAEVQPRLELQFDNYKNNQAYGPSSNKVSEIEGGCNRSESSHSGPEVNGVTSPETSLMSVLRSPGLLMDDENAMFPDDLNVQNSGVSSSNTDEDLRTDCESVVTGPSESVCSVITVSSSASHKLLSQNENAVDIKPSVMDVKETALFGMNPADIEDKIRKGWSRTECENLTLAELYLMFGDNGKLRLEYEWCEIKTNNFLALQQLTNLLRRLVHLANTEFSDLSKSKHEQPKSSSSETALLCHKCSGPVTSNAPAGKSNVSKSVSKVTSTKSNSSTSINSDKNTRSTSPESRDPIQRVPASMLTQGISSRRRALPEQTEPLKTEMLFGHGHYRRNRATMRKPMIVQRRLLPKAQTANHRLMSLTMIPPSNTCMSTTAQFLPMQPTNSLSNSMVTSQVVNPNVNHLMNPPRVPIITRAPVPMMQPPPVNLSTPINPGERNPESLFASQLEADLAAVLTTTPNTSIQAGTVLSSFSISSKPQTPSETTLVTPSCSPTSAGLSTQTVISPPSISSFLELSLSQIPQVSISEEKINSISSVLQTPPSGLDNSSQSSFKLTDSQCQWLSGEVADISLSGFLDLPEIKSSETLNIAPPNVFSEASRDITKMDVDTTLQCMLNESSLDYAAKFADIAAQMAASAAPPSAHLNTAEVLGLTEGANS